MTGLDEYESVLGMPSGPRPPDHYHLLGLELFESSQSVIAAAADGRIVEAEESVLASAEQIRQVVDRIRLAKVCLLDLETKAAYDRQLNQSVLGEPTDPVAGSNPDNGPGPIVGPHLADQPHDDLLDDLLDEPQFEALPATLIAAARPAPKRRSRKWFWAFTFVEGLCVIGLYFYLHPSEPVAMPTLPVGSRIATGKTNSVNPRSRQPIEWPPQRESESIQPAPTRGPFEPGDRLAANPPVPTNPPVAPKGVNGDNEPPALTEPEMAQKAMPSPTSGPPTPGPAASAEEGSPRPASVQTRPVWPNQWKLQFAGNIDGTIDHELLSLSADEIKTLAALREQPLFTLRDAITKKPFAALPFDNQGHLSGTVVAMLPKNNWRACLSYANQVLQGRVRIFDDQRRCLFFADYRSKGRTRLLCLCADGVPIAVQIWRGKDSVAYLIELADGQPVAREQKQLSAEQTERLGAALAELASIEAQIRDCEKDWKSQLSDWWKVNDNALRAIAVKSMPDSEKQSRRTAYYKQLFDEQHAGLDKLLSQFEPLPADPAVPKP
jgi:hypothetical protein